MNLPRCIHAAAAKIEDLWLTVLFMRLLWMWFEDDAG
jgi:hypothetical protein